MDEVQGSEKAIIPDDELLSMSQRIPKIDRETIHEEGIAALSRHSSVREDYSDENTAGMKNLLIKERSFKDYPNLQQGSEYEKDFEEFDPDLQSDSKYVPTEVEARVYQSSKANDMRAVIQAHNKNWGNNKSTKSARVEESEAHDISSTIRNSNSQDNQDDEWNPVWTQQRGMIVDGGTTTNIYGAAAQSIELRGDLYHGGTLADHEGDNYGDDQDYDDDDIDEEEQMQVLIVLKKYSLHNLLSMFDL